MGYAVLHIEKGQGADANMSSHIERKHQPANADETRTHLNKELIEFPKGVENRTEAIKHRIENAGIKRKIKKDQVRAIRIMLSGSPEDMERIQKADKLDDWCKDSLDWVKDTFGKDNLVSAVLHNDEQTPHIHATVVPIVTGERRKIKNKSKEEDPSKKKYKKKDLNANRLCVDDVITKESLIEFQDTYAEKMKPYGLERGVKGSEARHISTQQYYRDLLVKNENIQENIDQLLREQEAKQKELDRVKEQVKSQEVIKTVKSSIVGLFSNTENENLEKENEKLKDKIESLDKELTKVKSDKYDTIKHMEVQMKNNQSVVDKLIEYFPQMAEKIKIIRLCEVVGLAANIIKELLAGKRLTFKSGKLYSPQHKHNFDAEKTTIAIDTDPNNISKHRLSANDMDISDWFKLKYKELQQAVGIDIKQASENKKSRGVR